MRVLVFERKSDMMTKSLSDSAKCPECGQKDEGQTGEYPCSTCGLPGVWDERETPTQVADRIIREVFGDKSSISIEVLRRLIGGAIIEGMKAALEAAKEKATWGEYVKEVSVDDIDALLKTLSANEVTETKEGPCPNQ